VNHGHVCDECGKTFRCGCLIAQWEPQYRPGWVPLCRKCKELDGLRRVALTKIGETLIDVASASAKMDLARLTLALKSFREVYDFIAKGQDGKRSRESQTRK